MTWRARGRRVASNASDTWLIDQFPPLLLERQELRQPAAGHQLPLRDDADLAAQRLGVRQDVRAEEHGAAAIAQAEHELPHVAAAERVETGHRLVEEDDVGPVENRLGNADALHHALGVRAQAQAALLAQADIVEHGRNPGPSLRRRYAEQPAEVVEQFLGGQVVVEGRVLGQETEAPFHTQIADRTAEDAGVATGGEDQLHQQLDCRALAGAVGAEKAEDLALVDLQGELIERPIRPGPPEADEIVLGETVGLERQHVNSPWGTARARWHGVARVSLRGAVRGFPSVFSAAGASDSSRPRGGAGPAG